jgi:hypothetical protein
MSKVTEEHLKKAKEVANKILNRIEQSCDVKFCTNTLTCNDIATALAEAEEEGRQNAFTEIVCRKGKIKDDIITFKVPLTEIKKSIDYYKEKEKKK